MLCVDPLGYNFDTKVFGMTLIHLSSLDQDYGDGYLQSQSVNLTFPELLFCGQQKRSDNYRDQILA